MRAEGADLEPVVLDYRQPRVAPDQRVGLLEAQPAQHGLERQVGVGQRPQPVDDVDGAGVEPLVDAPRDDPDVVDHAAHHHGAAGVFEPIVRKGVGRQRRNHEVVRLGVVYVVVQIGQARVGVVAYLERCQRVSLRDDGLLILVGGLEVYAAGRLDGVGVARPQFDVVERRLHVERDFGQAERAPGVELGVVLADGLEV